MMGATLSVNETNSCIIVQTCTETGIGLANFSGFQAEMNWYCLILLMSTHVYKVLLKHGCEKIRPFETIYLTEKFVPKLVR